LTRGTHIEADTLFAGGLGTLTGIAIGIGDNFILDKLAKGWKPNQYIDEISKFIS
jgi:hypothetical protein